MSTRFPATGIDDGTTLPNPASIDKRNSPSHAGLHDNTNDAIKATQTKLGTGSSTPVVNTFLIGTGTGTSSWSQLTSAQVIASVTDETGTGSLVFGTTPTLITPKVDTINESTLNNGVTTAGLNVKAGVLQTSNSVVTANITDNNVTASKLATNAITLASIASPTSQSSISTSAVLLTGLSTSVTIPSGGRTVRIEVLVPHMSSTLLTTFTLYIYNSATVTGSAIATAKFLQSLNATVLSGYLFHEYVPSSGGQSYCAAISCDSGSAATTLTSIEASRLTVKVV